nr:MAG: RNA dependent RNA polymerase [Vaasa totivirus]
MIATGLGTIKAAQIAILANNSINVRTEAMQGLNAIRSKCGDDIAASLLDGIRAGATKYETDFHPTVLSWVQERALTVSVRKALDKGITGRDEMVELVAADFDCYIRSAREVGKLKQISLY